MKRVKAYQKYQITKFLVFLQTPLFNFYIVYLLFRQMPKMFVFNPPHLVSVHVFFHCKAQLHLSRLNEINSFPGSWSFKSQTVVIVSWPPFLLNNILTLQIELFHPFSSFSVICDFLSGCGTLWLLLKLLPINWSHQSPPSASSDLQQSRFPPDFSFLSLLRSLRSLSLELGWHSYNRFPVKLPR